MHSDLSSPRPPIKLQAWETHESCVSYHFIQSFHQALENLWYGRDLKGIEIKLLPAAREGLSEE